MKKLNGNEEFTLNGENYRITVNNFWSWAYSDLLNNTSRGILAEFLVYTATNREQSILNLDLWDFYVLPTAVLDRERPAQKSISLSALIRLQPTKVKFPDLGKTIESM